MKSLILGCLLLSGCTSLFSASTTLRYENPDGKTLYYESSKELEGVKVIYVVDDAGKVKEIRINVDRSTTSDAAVEAALQQQVIMGRILEQLIPLLKPAPVPVSPVHSIP